MAQMAKGGIVMDVINAEQARIAEEAGVCFFFHNVNSDSPLMCCKTMKMQSILQQPSLPNQPNPHQRIFLSPSENFLYSSEKNNFSSSFEKKKTLTRPTNFPILFLKEPIFVTT